MTFFLSPYPLSLQKLFIAVMLLILHLSTAVASVETDAEAHRQVASKKFKLIKDQNETFSPELPPKLWIKIFSMGLDIITKSRVAQVCNYFRELIEQDASYYDQRQAQRFTDNLRKKGINFKKYGNHDSETQKLCIESSIWMFIPINIVSILSELPETHSLGFDIEIVHSHLKIKLSDEELDQLVKLARVKTSLTSFGFHHPECWDGSSKREHDKTLLWALTVRNRCIKGGTKLNCCFMLSPPQEEAERIISEGIKESKKLQSIECFFNGNSGKYFLDGMAAIHSLERVQLTFLRCLTTEESSFIERICACHSLQELQLECGFTPGLLQAIAKGLQHKNSNMKRLSLVNHAYDQYLTNSETKTYQEGLAALIESLTAFSIDCLHLSNISLKQSSTKSLAHNLRYPDHEIKSLILNGCDINDDLALELLSGLAVNTSLDVLDISSSLMTNLGGEALIQCYKTHPCLKILRLSFPKFSQENKTILQKLVWQKNH